MFGRKISGERLRLTVWISSAVYAAVAALYFIPGGSDYEIVIPVAVLALFSIWLVPVPMSIALAASAAGDLMGAAGNFMVQMECFAVANLFLCLFFLQRLRKACIIALTVYRIRTKNAQQRNREHDARQRFAEHRSAQPA